MNDQPPDIEKLLRLKRHERPPEGFVDGFLEEFHHRQRLDAQKVPVWRLFCERVEARWHDLRFLLEPRWLYPLGAAYAALMIGLFFRQAKPTDVAELNQARQNVAAAEAKKASAGNVAVINVLPHAAPVPATSVNGAIPASAQQTEPTAPNGLRRTTADLVPMADAQALGTPQSEVPTTNGQVIILVR